MDGLERSGELRPISGDGGAWGDRRGESRGGEALFEKGRSEN